MTPKRLIQNIEVKIAIFAAAALIIYFVLRHSSGEAKSAVGAAAGLASAIPIL